MRTDYDNQVLKQRLVREAGAYLVHGLLYGFGYLPCRHKPERSRDIRTLVFVHGLHANRASFYPLQTYLRFKGYNRQLSFNYHTSGSIEAMAIKLKERIQDNIYGGRIDIIGHSAGGLVARYFVQLLGGARRVDRVITMGTPHCGSYPSTYFPTPLMYQFLPQGAFIKHLNEQPVPKGVQFYSLAGGHDLIVLPTESALAPFGHHRIFSKLGHMDLMLSLQVFKEIDHALAN